MSVAAFNKFSLLEEEDESSKGTVGLTSAKSKLKTVSPAQPTGVDEPKKPQKAVGGPASRSGRYYPRGGAPKIVDSAPAEDPQSPPTRFDRTEGRYDRGGRGRGEGRGGRGGRGGFNKDRHSRTNIVDSEKQVNQGWGADTGAAELASETQAAADAAAEPVTPAEPAATWGDEGATSSWNIDSTPVEGGDTTNANDDAEKPAPPEEDKTITFDEYLATKNDSALSELVPTVGRRLANDGAGEDLFKGAQQLLQGEEESYFAPLKTKSGPKLKVRKEKETIEIDGQFSEPAGGRGRGRGRGRGDFEGRRGGGGGGDYGGGSRGDYGGGHRGDYGGNRGDHGGNRGDYGERRGGDFRGRGEGRGRGGGNRGRGGYDRQRGGGQRVNVDDESAFPSLG